MATLLRLLWQAFFLSYLAHLFMLDPDTATFNDLLRILHAPYFVQLAEVLGITLVALEVMVSGFGAFGAATSDLASAAFNKAAEAIHNKRTSLKRS